MWCASLFTLRRTYASATMVIASAISNVWWSNQSPAAMQHQICAAAGLLAHLGSSTPIYSAFVSFSDDGVQAGADKKLSGRRWEIARRRYTYVIQKTFCARNGTKIGECRATKCVQQITHVILNFLNVFSLYLVNTSKVTVSLHEFSLADSFYRAAWNADAVLRWDSARPSVRPSNRSPLRAFQWAQDGHRTLSLSPQRVAQKRKVSKLENKLRYLRNGTR